MSSPVGKLCLVARDRGVPEEVRGARVRVYKVVGNEARVHVHSGPAQGATYLLNVSDLSRCRRSSRPGTLGHPPEVHTDLAIQSGNRATAWAEQSAAESSCPQALAYLLNARSASSAAITHVISGGTDRSSTVAMATHTVASAGRRFAARCLRRR